MFGQDPAHLVPPATLTALISSWLKEDTPAFDVGGYVVSNRPSTAHLYCKTPGTSILAGVPFFDEVFRQVGCEVTWQFRDGDALEVAAGPQGRRVVATVRGPTRGLLLGERVGLNCLSRCAGIATRSKRLLDQLRRAGYKNILAGTRKTTPGFRLVEKYGMIVGGCDPHRHDLSSMTMLKDNHVAASPERSITSAVEAAQRVGGFTVKVEVECQTVEEADEAIVAGADVVMLDNFTPEGVRDAVRELKSRWRRRCEESMSRDRDRDRERGDGGGGGDGDSHRRKGFLIEVSGGLTEANLEAYSVCWDDVDVFSTSAIHQGVPHVDFSLKIV